MRTYDVSVVVSVETDDADRASQIVKDVLDVGIDEESGKLRDGESVNVLDVEDAIEAVTVVDDTPLFEDEFDDGTDEYEFK